MSDKPEKYHARTLRSCKRLKVVGFAVKNMHTQKFSFREEMIRGFEEVLKNNFVNDFIKVNRSDV
jgi:hypothetical protein